MLSNELYLVVLPLIRVPSRQLGTLGVTSGSVQEFLTLFPDRDFATRFFRDEVMLYIDTFKATTRYLTGGHVTGYDLVPEDTDDGRVVVKVVQHVA
jgi:hypothetical protein